MLATATRTTKTHKIMTYQFITNLTDPDTITFSGYRLSAYVPNWKTVIYA